MNWKLLMATSLTAALAISAGCSTPPPTTLNINTQGGSGGSGGDVTSGETTDVGSGGNPEASQGREYYLSIVDSELTSTCASCHATGENGAPIFMGDGAGATYDALDLYGGLVVAPENSLLVLHGAHTGPALTSVEKNDILNWLAIEASERGLTTETTGGGATVGTLKQALDDYGACMDIADWKANGLDKLYTTQTTKSGPCGGCHQAGDGGNWLSSNAQETFDMNKKFPYIKRQVTGTVDEEGNFLDLIPANRWIQKGAELCQPGTVCHPAYVLPAALKTAITAFVTKTITKWHNKECSAAMP